jgi:uncharacterized membrane protein YhaH (DUF805 family)
MPLKILLIVLLFVLPITPTFWALQDIPRRRFPDRKKKLIWFLLVATLPCIGAMVYILFVRRSTVPTEPTLFEIPKDQSEVH